MSQLVHPDGRNPVSIIGVNFPDLLSRWKFGSCAELHCHVTTALEQCPVINVTPQYAYVDLHISSASWTQNGVLLTSADYGMDGISAVLGNCEKIIILFPPSSSNLHLLQHERGSQAKLARLLPTLEHGLIDRLDSSRAIFIPSGWAHATFTLRGGFLVSIDCATRSTVWPFSQYLKHDLHRELNHQQQVECWRLFLDCLEHALMSHEVTLASRSWCDIEDKLKHATDVQWRRQASDIWQKTIDKSPRTMLIDECGIGPTSNPQFREQHLAWLDDQTGQGWQRRR